MPLTDNIPEPLKKQIGPFPLWVWVGGIGGGLVLFMFLNRGDGGTDAADDTDSEPAEFDFEEQDGLFDGSDDTSGGTFDQLTSRVTSLEARKDNAGLTRKQVRTIARRQARLVQKNRKPNCRKGYHAVRRNGKWVCARNRSFTLAEPHIEMAGAPNGSVPTISLQNVPAIGIASPDHGPRAKVRPLNTTRSADPEPFVATKVPPAPAARAWGRPFHGAN